MASGSIYGEYDEDAMGRFRIDWEQTIHPESNSSTFVFKTYIESDKYVELYPIGPVSNRIKGIKVAYTGDYDDENRDTIELWPDDSAYSYDTFAPMDYIPIGTTYLTRAEATVYHNYDGSIPKDRLFGDSHIRIHCMFRYTAVGAANEISDDSVSDNIGEFCERILHPIKATVSTAYVGENSTITLNKRTPEYYATIEYSFGNLTGTIATLTNKSSISWAIPGNFLNEFGSTETIKKGTLTITTYDSDQTTIIGSTLTDFNVLLNSNISGPTFNPTIKDTNNTTIALTGNNKTIVRYYSNARITTGAQGASGATISSQKTTCGTKSFTGSVGTISRVETREYTINATDSRGLSSQYNGSFPSFVDYSKLSCNLFPNFVGTDGNLVFSIEGNCFKGSFGSVSNTLTLQYRYKEKDGSYGNWVTVSPNHTEYHNYSINVELSGLDYRKTYIFQAKATDKLATITTAEITMVSNPIFDWSENDFQFNVPVTANYGVAYGDGYGIAGVHPTDGEQIALMPCDSSGNTVLGYGNYTNENGSTLIYGGNSVDILTNGAFTVNGEDYSIIPKLVKAFTNSYNFTTNVTRGSNYSNASCSLTLRGNCLYCRFYASRFSASGVGDIADELMGTVTFNHGGKITGMDYVNGIAGTSGTTAAMTMNSPSVSGNTATFKMYLSNTAGAGSNFLASFVIPVSLNINNF